LFSSVNIVAQEKIVLVTGISSVLEQLDQVRELAVNVACVIKVSTTDFDRSLEFEQHGLGQEDLTGLETYGPDLALEQFDLFCALVQQFVNYLVDVDLLWLLHNLFEFDI
jgi:hypothetical protein